MAGLRDIWIFQNQRNIVKIESARQHSLKDDCREGEERSRRDPRVPADLVIPPRKQSPDGSLLR
jgi:hypothetical protein